MAKNKYLKRKFSLREIILMIVLVAVLFFGLYFWLVYYPIRDRIDNFNAQRQELQVRMDANKVRETRYDNMKAELEEIMKEEAPTRMPPYDNINNLTDCFAEIFENKNASEGITYGQPVLSDGIYQRTLNFKFNAENYNSAKDILLKLLGTGYRCLMNSLNISPTTSGDDIYNGEVKVETTIVFYEVA